MLMRRKSAGDEWVTCDQGHTHWGSNGAAGMLLRHTDPHTGVTRFFLQQRGPYVQNPGTWSTPGGAIEDGETPHAAAIRESQEELGNFPLTHLQRLHTLDHGGWAYHTMVGDVPQPFYPRNLEGDGESADSGWFTPAEVDELPLHPGFREGWDQYKPNQKPNPREVWTKIKTAEQRGWTDFYHVSPRANRESIMNLGLMGENGSSPWNDPWKRNNQPYGNYFFDNPQDAENYAWNLKSRQPDQETAWEDRYQHQYPEGFDEWPEEHQDQWYEGNEPVEQTDDPNGYDIWKVNTRGLPIHRDPESALNQDEPPTQTQLRQHYREVDYPDMYDEYGGGQWQQQLIDHMRSYGQTPRRFYTPEQVEPQRMQLHQHLPAWNMSEEELYNRMDDPEVVGQEVPLAWDEMQLRRPQFPAHSSWHKAELFVPELPEQEGSTEPQEVVNPEDHWPEWGERNPDLPSGTHTDYDWAYTRV